jgi:hypothetical protein
MHWDGMVHLTQREVPERRFRSGFIRTSLPIISQRFRPSCPLFETFSATLTNDTSNLPAFVSFALSTRATTSMENLETVVDTDLVHAANLSLMPAGRSPHSTHVESLACHGELGAWVKRPSRGV